jgi:hypothetical protein
MRVEITTKRDSSGFVEYYNWHYWDGPDGIDEYSGTCFTLGECFEHIFVARTRLERHYEEAFNE